MTPAIPPTAAPASAAPAAPVSHGAVLATVPDAPPAAARLEAGSIITGTVLGRDSQGLVTIRTDKGVLALATQANLPVGSTVSMEVRVAGTRLQLVVLSVELPSGEKLPLATGAAGTPAPALPASGGPTAPPTPAAVLAALSRGNLVMATVVHAAPPSTAAPPGGPMPGPGTGGAAPPTLNGTPPASVPATAVPPAPSAPAASPAGPAAVLPRLPDATLPAPTGAPGGSSPAMPAGAAGSPPAADGPIATRAGPPAAPPVSSSGIAGLPGLSPPPADAPAVQLAVIVRTLAGQPAPAAHPAQLPVGEEVGLRIVGAALPGDPAPDLPARPPGAPPLTGGIVVAETPAGHPVLDTPAGRLVLGVKAALPAGTMLFVELPPSLPLAASTPASPVATPDQALLRLSHGWPALAEALATLGDAQDPAAAAALAARLPQAGPRLAAGLVAMMSQLAAGEMGDWLGPALRETLERVGKRELADRLRGEFQQLSRLASEPAGGDWRVMFLPLHDGQELRQLNLYLRGRRRGADGEALDTGTRFVVEVDMTRLGPMQLDGLVHGRRFDLMLRSRAPLAPSMRRDIEAIFDEARAIGGYAGTIGFQVAQSFPVAPLEQAKRRSAAGGVVV